MIVLSTAFSTYLAKGHLDWLPDWLPLGVMGAAAIYYLATDPRVLTLFKTEAGIIIHPETNRPARASQLRIGKTGVTIVAVLTIAATIGTVAWKYRAEAFSVIGDPQFVYSGAYHDASGGPEQFDAVMAITLNNRARYATGLTEWKVFLKFKDGHTVEGVAPLVTDKDVPLMLADANGRQLTLRADDYLPIKAMQPITSGGATYGWLSSVFNGYTRSDIRGKGVILIVQFREIATGKQHSLTDSLDNPGYSAPPGIFRIRRKPSTH